VTFIFGSEHCDSQQRQLYYDAQPFVGYLNDNRDPDVRDVYAQR